MECTVAAAGIFCVRECRYIPSQKSFGVRYETRVKPKELKLHKYDTTPELAIAEHDKQKIAISE